MDPLHSADDMNIGTFRPILSAPQAGAQAAAQPRSNPFSRTDAATIPMSQPAAYVDRTFSAENAIDNTQDVESQGLLGYTESGMLVRNELVEPTEQRTDSVDEDMARMGMMPWVSINTTNAMNKVKKEAKHTKRPQKAFSIFSIGNLIWTALSIPFCLVYLVMSLLALLLGCLSTSKTLFQLGLYILFPYGCFLEWGGSSYNEFGVYSSQGRQMGVYPRIVYSVLVLPVVAVLHFLYIFLGFFFVCTIPMARMHWLVLKHSAKNLRQFNVNRHSPTGTDILYITYKAANTSYFKYAFLGINVLILDSLVIVLMSLIFSFLPLEWIEKNSTIVFLFSLVSIVPLAFLIGESIAQLSWKTNYGVGAVLNATFGSLIEIILYISALIDGRNMIVKMGMTGSLIGVLLLLPGLSMLIGGIKNKEMQINRTMGSIIGQQLLCSMFMMFAPSLYYFMYVQPTMGCTDCLTYDFNGTSVFNTTDVSELHPQLRSMACKRCETNPYTYQLTDPVFTGSGRILMYTVSILLFGTYLIGLVFNFVTHSFYYKATYDLSADVKKLLLEEKTQKAILKKNKILASTTNIHADVQGETEEARQNSARRKGKKIKSSFSFEQMDPAAVKAVEREVMQEELVKASSKGAGHKPGTQWHIAMTLTIMIGSTVLIALIAEGLIKSLEPAINSMGITEEFAGLTFFALIPSMSEFINACVFAARDHLTLAMEIGRAAALQIMHVQAPAVVLLGVFIHKANPVNIIYNLMNFVAVFIAVILHIAMADDRSHNWYKGIILIMAYVTVLAIFFFKPKDGAIADLEIK